MKQHLIFLISIMCLLSHNTKAMEQQCPAYFTGLVCPGPNEELNTEMLLNSNHHFWKILAQSSQTTKNKLLLEALNLVYPDDAHKLWDKQRKALACTLAAGANPNIQRRHDDTILHKVVLRNDYQLIKFALSCGADPNIKTNGILKYTALFNAKTLPIAQLLVTHKADISLHYDLSNTILHHIVQHSGFEVDLISYYIQQGCNVNAQNYWGSTPIMNIGSSNLRNDKTAFWLLLEAGADTTLRNNHGLTVWDKIEGKRLKTMQTIYKQYQQCKPCYALMNSLRLFSNASSVNQKPLTNDYLPCTYQGPLNYLLIHEFPTDHVVGVGSTETENSPQRQIETYDLQI